MGVVSFTINPKILLAKFFFFFPIPVTLSYVGDLVPKGGHFPCYPGDIAMVPLNWKLKEPPGQWGSSYQ